MRGLMGERLLKYFLGGSLNRPELVPEDEPNSEPISGDQTGAKPKRDEEGGQVKTPGRIVPKASPFASNDGAALTADMPFHTDIAHGAEQNRTSSSTQKWRAVIGGFIGLLRWRLKKNPAHANGLT